MPVPTTSPIIASQPVEPGFQTTAFPTFRGAAESREAAKTKVHDYLSINWKFGLHNYTLVEHPQSDGAPGVYRFATPKNEVHKVIEEFVFGASQGLSKNIYKHYTIGLVVNGMTHREFLDYCEQHSGLRELETVLEMYLTCLRTSLTVDGMKSRVGSWRSN
jgi:hypothetical protein